MPRIKSAVSVIVSATAKRSVVIDTDNNVWVSNAAQATPPAANTDFTTGYTKLYGVDAGKSALRGVVVSATGSKFYIYDFDGNATEWNLAASTQAETKFLSYSAVPSGSGPTTKVTFFSGLGSSGAVPIISEFAIATTPVPQLGGFQTFATAPVITTLAPVNTALSGATAPKVYAINDTFTPDGSQGFTAYDSVVITPPTATAPANIFLYFKGAGSDPTLKNSNAIRLILDTAGFDSLKKAIEKQNAGVFLFKDSKNYHLVTTDNSAKNALQVNAVDTVISPTSGRVLSSDKLDYAALNYLLNQPDFARSYDLSGTLIPIEGPLDYSEEGYQVPNSPLRLYSVSQKTLDASGEEVTKPLGLVLSTASTSSDVTASSSYYLGSSLSMDDLTRRSPSIFEKNNTLVIEWDSDSKADPLYLRVNKGAAGASVDKLTLDKLLNLESELKLDLDGDQNANGAIKYDLVASIKLSSTATTNTNIYKTNNDVFFTPKAGAVPLATTGVIDRADLLSRIDLVSPSRLRAYEVLNNRDLNRDGTIGAVVLSTVIENDNFSIYKTTAGDLVYSSSRGLSSGDRIPAAVGIGFDTPLTPDDQELIESSKVVVASIQQNGRLLSIASQVMDNMTGTTVLRENNFLRSVDGSSYAPSVAAAATATAPATPGPSVVYAYGYSTPERQTFLAREKYYDFDLNNDGVIGDAITAQLATNGSATVYQTAAGAIYISNDPTKNPGDVVGDAQLLYDLSNSPDRIDAAVFTYKADKTLSGARVFSSEIDNQNPANNRYSSEIFSLDASGILKSSSKTPLDPYELRQVEVQNTLDINIDGTIGDEIAASTFVIPPSSSSLGFGLYQLKTRFNDNPIFIAAKDGRGEADDAQPTDSIVYLKNSEGSASPFWSVPKYGTSEGKVVAGEVFSSSARSSVDVVVKDESKSKAFYLVNFDATGGTVKPNGTLLTPFALYNQEVKLNFDIDKNGTIGDTVTKLASSDDFGIYQLDRSGAIALTRENTWVDNGAQGVQKSLNFTALKNANGSTWLPFGWKQQLKSDGTFQLSKSADAAVISQAVFKADGTGSVYLTRKVAGPQGAVNTIYEVNFGSTGITKNPAGTALKPGDFYKTEMNALADINGDSFVGKPYLALPTTHLLRGSANLLTKFDGYEAFTDKWSATTSSKFSGKQYTVKAKIDPNSAIGWDGVNYSTNSLEVYDQQGRIVSSIATPNGWQIILGSGDFNGDGKGDFATVDWAKNQVVVYKGDDKGNFAPLQQVGISFEDQTNLPRYMYRSGASHPSDWMRPRSHGVTGDFNKDGLSDIAILETNSNKAQFKGNDVLGIYANTKGKISLVDTVVVGNNEYSDIVSGDLNKDGFEDLVLVGSENGSLKVILSDKGSFSKAGVLTKQIDLSGIYYPDHARIGDINNDGNADIIVGAKIPAGTSRIIQAFIGNGTGDFSEVQNLSKNFLVGLNSGGFGLDDLNKDGQLDVTLGNGQTFMNVSNVVDSSATYNFSSITSVDSEAFSKDYSAVGLGMKFKLKFDSANTIIDAAKDGSSVTVTSPNSTTTFDSKGGVVPQITIQNPAGGFNVKLNPSTDSRYLKSGQIGSYIMSNLDSGNLDSVPSSAELVDNKGVSHDYVVGVSGSYVDHDYSYTYGHYLKYAKGDRLIFNEPGSIQFVGTAAIQDSDFQSSYEGDERVVARMLWQPTRLASNPVTKDLGITSIDILLPRNLLNQKFYSDLEKVSSISQLNGLLGDGQFINLSANKLAEKQILPFTDYPTVDGKVLFDWSKPAIISKNPDLPSFVVMKYDQGDKIDFGWKWAAPRIRDAVAMYNAALESGDLFQIVQAFNAQPITVKSTFDSERFSVRYIDPYSDEFTQHFQNVSPSPFKPAETANMGAIQIHYKGYNTLDTPALFPIVHDENWSIANSYIMNRLGDQLYNIEASYATPDDMWLLFDKTKFPGIEDVTTVEDFVRIVGADSVNVEFVA
jgi:hypothetical protein